MNDITSVLKLPTNVDGALESCIRIGQSNVHTVRCLVRVAQVAALGRTEQKQPSIPPVPHFVLCWSSSAWPP